MPNREKPKNKQTMSQLLPVDRFFSWKGSFLVMLVILLSTLIIPVTMMALDAPPMLTVTLVALTGSFGIMFVRTFYELKKGFSKSFWIKTALLFVAFFAICYLWIVQQIFV